MASGGFSRCLYTSCFPSQFVKNEKVFMDSQVNDNFFCSCIAKTSAVCIQVCNIRYSRGDVKFNGKQVVPQLYNEKYKIVPVLKSK